jgi:multiple sugar transport system permease protein
VAALQGASAFNVIIVKRFFDNLPREIFEAARIDGAGPFALFWRNRPADVETDPRRRLGLRSVGLLEGLPLADARSDQPDKQPLGVRLPAIQSQTELGVFLAAMFIACIVPIGAFLIFQRSFLRSSGLGGAIKG